MSLSARRLALRHLVPLMVLSAASLAAAAAHTQLAPGQLSTERGSFGEIPLADGRWLLVGNDDRWHPDVSADLIDPKSGKATAVAPLPVPLVSPVGIQLKDHSVLVYGALPVGCGAEDITYCHEAPPPSFRWHPDSNTWDKLSGLTIPFQNGAPLEGGNRALRSLWARTDSVVRDNGDFIYLGADPSAHPYDAFFPPSTTAYRWQPGAAPQVLAKLNLPRVSPTLLTLASGQLAVVGGAGPVFSEVYDDHSHRWKVTGAPAHHAGGRALKLADGDIFKFGLNGTTSADGYFAEVADPALTSWKTLWELPLQNGVDQVREVVAVGHCALILSYHNDGDSKLVIWDNQQHQWSVAEPMPGRLKRKSRTPASIRPVGNNRILIRQAEQFEVVDVPGVQCEAVQESH